MLITSLLCSGLRLSRLLFVTSPSFLLKFLLFHYLFLALLEALTVSSSVCYVAMPSTHGFHWFIICLLRHHAISSRLTLFHYLFLTSLLCPRLRLSLPLLFTSPCFLLKVFIGLLSVCCVTVVFWASTGSSSVLLLHCTISSKFPLFHYLFVTSLLCYRLRLSLLLFATPLCFLLMVSIVSLSDTSLLCSSLRLSLPLFATSLVIQAISVAPL